MQEEPRGTRLILRGTGVTLFEFGAPRYTEEAGGGRVCFPISGGFLLAREPSGEGRLCLTLSGQDAATRICMLVEGYHPRLAGSGRSPARCALYKYTQATLHHWIAMEYLRALARDMIRGKLHTRHV